MPLRLDKLPTGRRLSCRQPQAGFKWEACPATSWALSRCQIRLLVQLPVRTDITTGTRVVWATATDGPGRDALSPNELGCACGGAPLTVSAGDGPAAGGGGTAGGGGGSSPCAGTSSGAMGGKSAACVDMLADDGAGVQRRPTCPVVDLLPAAPGAFRAAPPPAAAVFPQRVRRFSCRR